MAEEILANMEVKNISATFNLGMEVDLFYIYCRTRNSEYSPRDFPGLRMRMRIPVSCALIFKSGKVNVVGTKNEADARLASHKYTKLLQKIGLNVVFKDYKLNNIVATIDVRFPIELEELNRRHMQFTSYEPEVFASLSYRLPNMVFNIFASGKLVVTGAKSREAIKDAFEYIYKALVALKEIK
ncbi:TBP-related factor-like [Teleopsis dalmanni]|uniref:TBP-related factor-like n=1 Tax=Teleopsis dalmanni TaxID=139649 RepID=UPI0018CDAD5C|nr:TBP-related factor-like [Teleopsis dalmanni]